MPLKSPRRFDWNQRARIAPKHFGRRFQEQVASGSESTEGRAHLTDLREQSAEERGKGHEALLDFDTLLADGEEEIGGCGRSTIAWKLASLS